jgi:HEAT repeat protein
MRAGLLACILVAACRSATPRDAERLVPLVHDGDRGVRYAAVMALGKAGTGEGALAKALRDPEWCVRAEAAVALARVGPRALPLVLEAAGDADREVRLESWTALRKMGPDAVRAGHGALRAGLASADAGERLEAARCLVLLGPEEDAAVLPVVLHALEHVDGRDLVCRAAWCVQRMGPRALPALRLLRRRLRQERYEHLDALSAAVAAVEPAPPPPEKALSEAEARARLEGEAEGAVLDGAIGLERLGIDPGPLLAARDDAVAARVFVILGPGPTPVPPRWLAAKDAVVRESAALALGQRGLAAEVFGDPDPRVRAAAVWSHGRAGLPLPDAMRDEDGIVREMAVRTLGPRGLGAALLDPDLAVRRLAANRCAEGRVFVPELLATARARDHDLRILATRALSRCRRPFLPALEDPSCDVRLEAVRGLAARHEDELLRALADPQWRVRRAALQRLGRSGRAAEAAASSLGDLNPLLSEVAADALARMGSDAARPLARALPGANHAVHHQAPRIFHAIGAEGAAAVPILIALLADSDVNVREMAARCLTGIGPGARDASAALVEALADARLCVVSHAALALGHIGVTPELVRALRDPRARVRAYAAFAYGWARGAERGLDQVPFEVRLPVLDCGDAPPGKFLELRSKDPAVAIPCAAACEAEELDAWECERVMELLLCGGCRPEAPGDFDRRFRNVLGSAELPAQMQYLVRARRTDRGKEHIFSENHRIARRENIPALLWFARTEDADSLSGVGSLDMPTYSTHDVSLFVRDPCQRQGPGIPPALRAWIEGDTDLFLPDGLWWLDEVTPLESDAPDLLGFARWAFGPDGDHHSRHGAVRALGKVYDAASERFLREADFDGASPDWRVTMASLARRGHPDALADLLEDGALSFLLEAAPGFAVARVREDLLDPVRTRDACELLAGELEDTYLGLRFEETLFAGFAEAAIASDLDSHALARIAITVPGCRRAALAEAAFARLDPGPWLPNDGEPDLDAAAFLHSADSERFVAVLREWSNDPDERVRTLALGMLLRIGDPPSAKKLLGIVHEWHEYELLARTRAPAVERFLIERAEAGDEAAREGLFKYLGFRWLAPEGPAATAERAARGAAVPSLLAEIDPTRERRLDPEFGLVRDARVLDWLRTERERRRFERPGLLGALVLAGDREARAELWSMIRCGRHRLCYSYFDERVFTLDWDLSTLPHWIEELDSNCCRVAGGLEGIFQDHLGMSWLYQRPWTVPGEPRSQRVRTELLWSGGRYVWSPLVDRFVSRPD